MNSESRFKAQAQASLPPPSGTIAADDSCNKNGDDGSVAEQVGAQMRRSGSEWASTCLATYGVGGLGLQHRLPRQHAKFRRAGERAVAGLPQHPRLR